jgi:hypothetical protein
MLQIARYWMISRGCMDCTWNSHRRMVIIGGNKLVDLCTHPDFKLVYGVTGYGCDKYVVVLDD